MRMVFLKLWYETVTPVAMPSKSVRKELLVTGRVWLDWIDVYEKVEPRHTGTVYRLGDTGPLLCCPGPALAIGLPDWTRDPLLRSMRVAECLRSRGELL